MNNNLETLIKKSLIHKEFEKNQLSNLENKNKTLIQIIYEFLKQFETSNKTEKELNNTQK
jgi:hypothetical protein